MKKALLVLGAVAMSASVFAQDGTLTFSNRNVPTPAGDGTTYNIPIWAMGGTNTDGAGDLPGGVTVGLYLPGSTTPLATAVLRTDANSQFFGNPSSQSVTITGFAAGSTPTLEVKAWQGPGTYADALAAGRQVSDPNNAITFTTRPLGGTPAGGGLPITPPGVTGLITSGQGITLTIVPEPSVMALGALGIGAMLLRRRK